jgi:cell division protein FtsI (penicillin-binding protein 3)
MRHIKLKTIAITACLFATGANAQDQSAQSTSERTEISGIINKHLAAGLDKYQALAAAAVLIDAKTGHILVSTSLQSPGIEKRDIIKNGLFEFGHVAKIATIAAGLESNAISPQSKFDVRQPLKIGRYTIGDKNPQNRILSLQEVALYSSNIGSAKIGLKVGGAYQALFQKTLGIREKFEGGSEPIFAQKAEEVTVAANAFGHGFAISPLHAVSAFATLTNPDGRLIRASINSNPMSTGLSVVSPATTAEIGRILRMNVKIGGARVVDVPGLQVGAMTATSEKVKDGRYLLDHVTTSTIAVTPYYDPKYVILVMFDDPKAAAGEDYKTAAWNSGKVLGEILKDGAEFFK